MTVPGETRSQSFQRHQRMVQAGLTLGAAVPAVLALRRGKAASTAGFSGHAAAQSAHAAAQLRHAATATGLTGLAGAVGAFPTPHRLLQTDNPKRHKQPRPRSLYVTHRTYKGAKPAASYTNNAIHKQEDVMIDAFGIARPDLVDTQSGVSKAFDPEQGLAAVKDVGSAFKGGLLSKPTMAGTSVGEAAGKFGAKVGGGAKTGLSSVKTGFAGLKTGLKVGAPQPSLPGMTKPAGAATFGQKLGGGIKAHPVTTGAALGAGGVAGVGALHHQMTKKDRFFSEKFRATKKAHAMPGGGFPIPDADALRRAKMSVGRASNPAAARAHINSQAKRLGLPGIGKAYTPGTITYHHQQAMMHGRKKSAANRQITTGVGTAGWSALGAGAMHHGAPKLAEKLVPPASEIGRAAHASEAAHTARSISRSFRAAGAIGVGTGLGIAGVGVARRMHHGTLQNTHTKAAQAARRARSAENDKITSGQPAQFTSSKLNKRAPVVPDVWNRPDLVEVTVDGGPWRPHEDPEAVAKDYYYGGSAPVHNQRYPGTAGASIAGAVSGATAGALAPHVAARIRATRVGARLKAANTALRTAPKIARK